MKEQEKMPKATHSGNIEIGQLKIACSVLEDGRRVLSGRTVTTSLGLTGRGQGMRRIIESKSLKPFITKRLQMAIENPIVFKGTRTVTHGYEAWVLPEICQAILTTRDDGKLPVNQSHMAIQADILIRAFATVGIIALIDEVTGYQEIRDRNELNRILEAYIAKELLPWTKRFPDEFYEQLFRLLNWQYSPMSAKRPGYVGTLTNQLVYEKLPPGVIEELREINPSEKGRRKHKHHQFLTEEIGNPHLEKHIASVTTLMRISPNYKTFKKHFDKAFPPPIEQIEIFEQDDGVAISSEE